MQVLKISLCQNGNLSVVHDEHPDKRSEGGVAKEFCQRAPRCQRQPYIWICPVHLTVVGRDQPLKGMPDH